jgi:C-1 hydroxylase
MSTDENKNLVRKLIDAWNDGDLDALMSYWSPRMVHHGRDGALEAHSVAGEMSGFLAAFPDIHIDLEGLVAEGEMVATRLRLNATHQGEYLGRPPTGKRISCALMGQLRIVDGKVVEHWGVADALHMLRQLDLVPEHLLAATA